MNGNDDFVSFTVDPDAVIEVLVLIVGCELNINIISDSRWNHPFFIVLDLKVRRRWREDMETLRVRRVVDNAHPLRVGLPYFKT